MKKIFSKVVAILLLIITTLFSVPQKVLATENKDNIEDFINKNNKNGASVILIEDGEIANEFNVGYANKENNIKIDSSTVFEWGSTSKLLVWVSIMQLVEEGKISLEDDILEFLPSDFFSKLKYDKPITILNLMNHNAGWADNNKDLLIWDSEKILPLNAAIKKYEPKQIYAS